MQLLVDVARDKTQAETVVLARTQAGLQGQSNSAKKNRLTQVDHWSHDQKVNGRDLPSRDGNTSLFFPSAATAQPFTLV